MRYVEEILRGFWSERFGWFICGGFFCLGFMGGFFGLGEGLGWVNFYFFFCKVGVNLF